MTVKAERTFSINAAPQKVMDCMRSPELIDESERSRDAKDVQINELESSEQIHKYEILTKTPARTVKGIDKTKTEDNRTVVTWDLTKRFGTWDWRGPQGDRAKVTGTYSVTEQGDGSSLRLTVQIDIGIPVVGKMIEKKVRDGFEKSWPDYAARIRNFSSR